MRVVTTVLALCSAVLLSLGLVVLFSSTTDFSSSGPAMLQLTWGLMGIGAAAVVALTDYRFFKRVSWLLFLAAILLLGWVLLAGEVRNGARRWLSFGPLGFQPSEFAKLALVVGLAHYGERYQGLMPRFWRGLMVPVGLAGLLLGLIFLEPDWGTTLLLAAVTGGMLLVAGVRWRHALPIAAGGALVLALVLLHNPNRLGRVESWLRPEATKEGVGYQAYQAKLAMGSGGWTGKGLGHGEHYGFVPEYQTDFILAPLGEELGLACTLTVVGAFGVILLCGLGIAWRARDVFGLLLASGLTFLIGLQAIINLGVVTGVLPNKGLPLPFVSRGGSSLFMMLVCVGALLSIARCIAREDGVEEPLPDLEEVPLAQSS